MGGSSGSSGGSSGAVDYPEYMKDQHETWLDDVAADIPTAQSANPYATATAYDPDTELAATNTVISHFYDIIEAIDPDIDWGSNYDVAEAKFDEQVLDNISTYSFDSIFDADHVTDLINSYQTDLETRRDDDFKPAYKVGMQNVNAVMSSAFVVGDALITAQVARDVADFSADLNFKNEEKLLQYQQIQAQENTDHNRNIITRNQLEIQQATNKGQFALNGEHGIDNLLSTQLQFGTMIAQMTAEANRIKIVAKGEENERNIKFDTKDAIWDLEMYQYGGNIMASIAGSAINSGAEEPSTGASVLGGAMSGAAMGAMATGGNPMGALAGGVMGGIAGLL